ncbi:hypothetical protein Tco_0763678, partial [Tanacetum coccineum]
FHEVNFQVYSNPLFEFDDNFKSSNVNPLFEENDKDAEIKSSSTLTSPEDSEFEAYLEIDSIPPGIDLTLPPTIEVSSSNTTSPTLTGEKDLTVLFDSSESSILPPLLLDSDSPFTAELSASVTLNSLGNKDKVFKPGILVYHAIHDKNLVTLEENLKENISSGTLLVFKEPSIPRPPPEPPDIEKRFTPEGGILIIKEFKGVSKSHDFMTGILPTLPTLVSDLSFISSFVSFESEDTIFDPGIITFLESVAFSMEVSCSKYGYIKNHKKTFKNRQARTRESKEYKKEAKESKPKPEKSTLSQSGQIMVNRSQPQEDKTQNDPNKSLNFSKVTKIVPGP